MFSTRANAPVPPLPWLQVHPLQSVLEDCASTGGKATLPSIHPAQKPLQQLLGGPALWRQPSRDGSTARTASTVALRLAAASGSLSSLLTHAARHLRRPNRLLVGTNSERVPDAAGFEDKDEEQQQREISYHFRGDAPEYELCVGLLKALVVEQSTLGESTGTGGRPAGPVDLKFDGGLSSDRIKLTDDDTVVGLSRRSKVAITYIALLHYTHTPHNTHTLTHTRTLPG